MFPSREREILIHGKKRFAVFSSPAGMSLTKISLAGNNYIVPGVSDILAGGRKTATLFLQCKEGAGIEK